MEKFGSTMSIPSVLAPACAQLVSGGASRQAIGRVVTAPRAFGFPQEKSALGLIAGKHVSLILGTTAENYTNTESPSPRLDGFSGVPPRGRPV